MHKAALVSWHRLCYSWESRDKSDSRKYTGFACTNDAQRRLSGLKSILLVIRMNIRFLFALLVLLPVTFANAAPVTSVPFTVEKNCIYFYCSVNGTDSVRFLFDTGASSSVINLRSGRVKLPVSGDALNTGSNGNNAVKESRSNDVQFGSITRAGITFLLIDFDTELFDGVFGCDLMKGHIVEIDYTAQELRFYTTGDTEIDFSGYEKNRLRLIDDYPCFQRTFRAGQRCR